MLTSKMETITSINEIDKYFSKKLDRNIKSSPSEGVKELHLTIKAVNKNEIEEETWTETLYENSFIWGMD